ncbi:unnamed protein product [Urochloa humidicola]
MPGEVACLLTSTPAAHLLRRIIAGTVLAPVMAAAAKVAEREKVQVKVVGIPVPLCAVSIHREKPQSPARAQGSTIRLAEGHPSPSVRGTTV